MLISLCFLLMQKNDQNQNVLQMNLLFYSLSVVFIFLDNGKSSLCVHAGSVGARLRVRKGRLFSEFFPLFVYECFFFLSFYFLSPFEI